MKSFSKKIEHEEFDRFVVEYSPFPWETAQVDVRPAFARKHSFEISYERFKQVLFMLKIISKGNPLRSFIDVGPYPGNVWYLVQHYFGQIERAKYVGVGLGFSENFQATFQELGATLVETELDPDHVSAKKVVEWNIGLADCCLLLDVIEHLANPTHLLDQINKYLKMDGYLIVTTDNISQLGYLYRMFRFGKSPNSHPLQTSIFYRGDWRPHARELSRQELEFFLNYSGFEIVHHKFFERKQGDFKIDREDSKIIESKRYRGIKGMAVKLILKCLPHLRDHQIVLAKKIKSLNDVSISRPKSTTNLTEWLNIRSSAGVD